MLLLRTDPGGGGRGGARFAALCPGIALRAQSGGVTKKRAARAVRCARIVTSCSLTSACHTGLARRPAATQAGFEAVRTEGLWLAAEGLGLVPLAEEEGGDKVAALPLHCMLEQWSESCFFFLCCC